MKPLTAYFIFSGVVQFIVFLILYRYGTSTGGNLSLKQSTLLCAGACIAGVVENLMKIFMGPRP